MLGVGLRVQFKGDVAIGMCIFFLSERAAEVGHGRVCTDKNPVCSVLFVVPYTESDLESSKERISKSKASKQFLTATVT